MFSLIILWRKPKVTSQIIVPTLWHRPLSDLNFRIASLR